MSWYGETWRHAQAARGIKTAHLGHFRTLAKNIMESDARAKEWATKTLWGLAPDDIGEEITVIDGHEYLLTYEGWGESCFIGAELGSEEECRDYAWRTGLQLVEEEWPRYWEARDYEQIAGGHDKKRGQFGMTWALWVREL